MAEYTLTGASREIIGKKVRQLRSKGIVPGTIYGAKFEPMTVQFPYRELEVALMRAGGTNLIDITIDGEVVPSLAREVQRDVLKGFIEHVDFIAVNMDTKISAEIPISFVGQSPVVVARKGVLITGPNSITIEALPDELRNSFEIDISGLTELGDSISVKDLRVNPGVTIMNDPEEVLVKVVQTSAARQEEMAEMLEGAEGEVAEGEAPAEDGDEE